MAEMADRFHDRPKIVNAHSHLINGSGQTGIYNCTVTPFTLPVPLAYEHVENKWHASFLSLLTNQLRAFIIYSHLHVTLNSCHD